MKRKIKIIDHISKPGKTIITEHEVEIRDLDHLQAQISNPHHVFKPKKGKGSYKRTQKHKNNNIDGGV